MKILFISYGGFVDYQCDMLFHGLRSLLGAEVVDVARIDYMYKGFFNNNPKAGENLYGKGFSVYGLLDDDLLIDRDDIKAKINNHYFDIVIYGSIHRSQEYIDEVLAAYKPSEIFLIDGEDGPNEVFWPLLGRGLYMKRELLPQFGSFMKPIHFAIPLEKFCEYSNKTKIFSFIDPRDRSTYIYDNEVDYYADYSESLFGYTMKKAGWDCLRHYEIIANHCIPFFPDLVHCPLGTMHRFPRYEIFQANKLMSEKGPDYFLTTEGLDIWQKYASAINIFAKTYLTTQSLAEYIIDVWKQNKC